MDIIVKKNTNGSLSPALFHMSTVGNTILHASSAHPAPLIHSTPYGQSLRLKHNCTDSKVFEEEARKLQTWLLARGYCKKCPRKAYNSTKLKSREMFLFSGRSRQRDNGVRFVTRYNYKHQAIKKALQKYWYLLTLDSVVSKFITPQPSVVFHRAPSLKDKLVYSYHTGHHRNIRNLPQGMFK